MKTYLPKRILFKDNCKLVEEMATLRAANIELVIKLEQQNELIDEINAKNEQIMLSLNKDKNE